MNKEERTKTLINNIKLNINEQNVYEFGLCVEQWKQILDYVGELQQENKQLKDNWNKLRETLKNEQLGNILYSDKTRFASIDEILDKMQELEKSDGDE